ncbi:hypothetical protein CHUAL_002745 [Chamberlinius hualienensis]
MASVKFIGIFLAITTLIASPIKANIFSGLKSNGGGTCMACTIFTGLWRQIMQVNDMNSTEAIDYFLDLFPEPWHEALEVLEPFIIEKYTGLLNSNATPDVACYTAGYCVVDPGYHYCNLWPVPEEGMEMAVKNAKATYNTEPVVNLCDPDGDNFTINPTMRGFDWRGQDCAENNSDIYPGRLPINSDRDFDSNCNGIWGVNPDTGNAYEDELCGDQENYGIIYIGDSIGAHFHIPPDWLRAEALSPDLYTNLTYIALNELDWPHMSWGTGFVNSTWPVTINSPTNSLYWRLRNRNLCNHRDYQNLAFNGARSFTVMDSVPSMHRDDGNDKPAIVIYAEFGNDICRSHSGDISEMTTPQYFHDSVIETLDYLETRLPAKSHVFLTGLVNGTFLYSILKGRFHPIGELNSDVTYDNIYNYFSCMQTVCPAWTNTNTTEQNIATDYARILSGVLMDIASTANYTRFDIHYLPCPLDYGINEWTGELWELIEPVDGLHPSKHGQDMFAQVAWEILTAEFADILGPENPNNAKIIELFGDQGGH